MRRLLKLSFGQIALLAEALVALAVATFAVRCLPFRWIAARLGETSRESAENPSEALRTRIAPISWALDAAARRLPRDPKCLARAIAGKAMLRRRGLVSTLYLGVDTRGETGFTAHAWLRCGSFMVTGGGSLERYSTVASFAETEA